jgi:hypothetical protein
MVVERGDSPALAHRAGKVIELLGGRPQLIETLSGRPGARPVTAPELAEHLELKLPNTNQRLKLLLQAGALGRVLDHTAEHGSRFEYYPLRAREVDGGQVAFLDSKGVSNKIRDRVAAKLQDDAPVPASRPRANGNGSRRPR